MADADPGSLVACAGPMAGAHPWQALMHGWRRLMPGADPMAPGGDDMADADPQLARTSRVIVE